MGSEDDFGLWEREMEGVRTERGTGARALLVVAALTAAGCTALIVLGQAPLGTAGLVLSSIILLLWRVGL